MSMATGYGKSRDGLTHLLSTSNSEFTLCGDAFDIDSEKGYEHHAWEECEKQTVTCPRCVTQIKACRGVKLKAVES